MAYTGLNKSLFWGVGYTVILCIIGCLAAFLSSLYSFSSFQFSRSIMSDSLWPHEPQHARPPCPSPTPGVYPNSCPLSQWCHPIISSSVASFFSCPQPLPASGSFPVSHLIALGSQSVGASASSSVLPMNIQSWFLWEWLVWSSCCPRSSQEPSPTPQFKSINSLAPSLLYGSTLICTWLLEKP